MRSLFKLFPLFLLLISPTTFGQTANQQNTYNQQVLKLFNDLEKLSDMADEDFDKFFDDGFFKTSAEIFKQMDKKQRELLKQFENSYYQNQKSLTSNSTNSFGVQKLTTTEKDGKIYYHITIPGLDEGNVNIKVSETHVTINGQLTQTNSKTSNQGKLYSQVQTSNHFHNEIPLPFKVNPGKVQYEKKKDEVIVIIPKQ